MAESVERSCLERMCDLIASSEDRILEAVNESVRVDGIERAPRTAGAWGESVRGLSDAIFQAVYSHLEVAEDGPRRDPVVAYGVLRGRTQGDRGVMASDWWRLLRCYRRAYLDLVLTADFRPDELLICRRFIDWVFDRMEDGFMRGYDERSERPQQVAGE